jgi:NADH dehydrogenase
VTDSPTLVVGATGLLGSEIVRLLCKSGRPTRALVRAKTADQKRAALAECAEVVSGDLRDYASLEAACRGVSTVISTASAALSQEDDNSIEQVDDAGQKALLAAAKAAGVRRFVYISFPPLSVECELQRIKREVENAVKASGLSFTILQPTQFAEAWLSPATGFNASDGKVLVLGDGHNAVSWISVHDVARFAIAATEGNQFSNQVLTLGGPDPLTPLEVVRIFEEVRQESIHVDCVPVTALKDNLAAARNTREQAMAAFALATANGLTVDPQPALALLPGRLTTVREHAKRILNHRE